METERTDPVRRTGRARPPALGSGWTFGLLLILAVVAAFAVLYTTSNGPVAGSDSVAYIVAARNLLEGNGLGWTYPSGEFHLLTHFPPLYSLTLALFGLGGADLIDVARFVSIASFVVVISTTAAAMFVATGSKLTVVAVAAAILADGVVLSVFSRAMSEPLFLVFQTTGVLLLLFHSRAGRLSLAAAAGLALGLAAVSRYIGIALLVGGALGVLFLGGIRPRRRLIASGIFTAFGLLPSLLWGIFLVVCEGSTLPRQVSMGIEDAWVALRPFRGSVVDGLWSMLPIVGGVEVGSYRIRLALLAGLVLAGSVTAWWAHRAWQCSSEEVRGRAGASLDLAGYSLMLAICYLGGLAAAFLFVRPAPDIDARMLVPLRILLWHGAAATAHLTGSLWARLAWLRRAPVVLAALAIAWAAPSTLATARSLHEDAVGYAGSAWRESCLIQEVRGISREVQLISNDSAAILFLTGRSAYDIPELLDCEPRVPFRRFGESAGDVTETIYREDGAALVLFSSAYWQFDAIYHPDTQARLDAFVAGLDVRTSCPDGEILYYASAP